MVIEMEVERLSWLSICWWLRLDLVYLFWTISFNLDGSTRLVIRPGWMLNLYALDLKDNLESSVEFRYIGFAASFLWICILEDVLLMGIIAVSPAGMFWFKILCTILSVAYSTS